MCTILWRFYPPSSVRWQVRKSTAYGFNRTVLLPTHLTDQCSFWRKFFADYYFQKPEVPTIARSKSTRHLSLGNSKICSVSRSSDNSIQSISSEQLIVAFRNKIRRIQVYLDANGCHLFSSCILYWNMSVNKNISA